VVTDPGGDCTVRADKGRLTVTVPGTHHNLHPQIGPNNAPRILRELEGDFTVQVRVSFELDPSEESTLAGGAPFIGAGLLLWQDDRTFLRLERNVYRLPNVTDPICYPPLFSYFENGRYMGTDPPPARASFFKGPGTYLRLQRRGQTVSAAYSHDGKGWTGVKEINVALPQKLHVGVAAVSTSAKPFTATFEGLASTSP
jgi:hypothetical protein